MPGRGSATTFRSSTAFGAPVGFSWAPASSASYHRQLPANYALFPSDPDGVDRIRAVIGGASSALDDPCPHGLMECACGSSNNDAAWPPLSSWAPCSEVAANSNSVRRNLNTEFYQEDAAGFSFLPSLSPDDSPPRKIAAVRTQTTVVSSRLLPGTWPCQQPPSGNSTATTTPGVSSNGSPGSIWQTTNGKSVQSGWTISSSVKSRTFQVGADHDSTLRLDEEDGDILSAFKSATSAPMMPEEDVEQLISSINVAPNCPPLRQLFANKAAWRRSFNNSAPPPQQRHCNYCKGVGEPWEVYRSHVIRDANGQTTCPKLANERCYRCHRLGHTSRYCEDKWAGGRPTNNLL